MTDALLPAGFADRLPPLADAAAALEAAILGVARAHGYERADPALAEFEAGLAGRLKAGRVQHAVRFVDPVSQRTLAIRPDITAQIGRIAATRMAHHPRPVRLCYAGSVLKLRGSELAPARALRQIGCELIGLDTVAAAREVVGVAVEALTAAGVRGLSLDFTLPDLVDTLAAGPLPLASEQVAAVRERLDAKDAGAIAALAPGYQPLIAAAGPFDDAVARLSAFDAHGALTSRLDAVQEIAASLPAGVALTLDPTERHGFEFQSWLGFSLFAAGARGEIGRGGSYSIVREDGGEEAAIGFTLYSDAILAVRPADDTRRRLFVPLGSDPADAARLRAEGWVTVAQLGADDTPAAQLCTHRLESGTPRPL